MRFELQCNQQNQYLMSQLHNINPQANPLPDNWLIEENKDYQQGLFRQFLISQSRAQHKQRYQSQEANQLNNRQIQMEGKNAIDKLQITGYQQYKMDNQGRKEKCKVDRSVQWLNPNQQPQLSAQQAIKNQDSSQNMIKSDLISPTELNFTSQSKMKKLKSGFIYNVSETKAKFVIHSKPKIQRNQIQRQKSHLHQMNNDIAQQNSKEEINKIYEMIQLLQEKLSNIQKRQANRANQKNNQTSDPFKTFAYNQPAIKKKQAQENCKKIPSIVEINQLLDKNIKENQANQSQKLKQEISRLKNVIRQMQIEKIKSNQEGLLSQSVLRRKLKNSLQKAGKKTITLNQANQPKEISKHIQSYEHFQSNQDMFSHSNRLQNAGKIIHIPNSFSLEGSRSFSNIQARNGTNLPKLNNRQRGNHSFMESSRIIESGEFPSNSLQKGTKQNSNLQSNKLHNLSNIQSDDFDKDNPQLSISMLQVNFRDIQTPNLPMGPNASMNQQQLQNLAKTTYSIFDVKIEDDKNLMVKKYKNCVFFTINNQQHLSILWHYSGKFYMGGWRNSQIGQGQKDGQGLQITPGKHIYKGQFLNGKKSGTGIMKLQNGSVYDGQWMDSNKNGRGVYFDSTTKAIYNGEWKDNKKEGQGFLKISEGQYYYGTFVKSIKEGFGEETFINGDKYKGEYRFGKFHGKGKYIWANGSRYEGQFIDGARNGEGSWKSAKTNYDLYVGSYKNDKKNGYGRYIWANGSIYQGQFANDMKHGKGRITYSDGTQSKGVWKEGVLTVNEKEKHGGQQEDKPLQRAVRNIPANLMSPSKRSKR